MELRQYGRILARRWWAVVGITLAALAASVLLSPAVHTTYVATTRVVVSLPPEPREGNYFTYDRLYAFQSAEFLVDDFAEVVKSRAFAEDIKAELNDPGIGVGTISGSQATEKTHRVLSLRLSAADEELARRMAEAAVRVLRNKGNKYFAQLGAERAVVEVIDPPAVAPQSSLNRILLEIGLRTALGLLAGVALAFLLHYLDNALYEAQEVERLLGLPVLGEIPPER